MSALTRRTVERTDICRHERRPCVDVWQTAPLAWSAESCRNPSSWRVLESQLNVCWSERDLPPFISVDRAKCVPVCIDIPCQTPEPPPPHHHPRAKLFSALYWAPCSTPPTRRSRSNSRRLVKVGLPEMWKSVMGDSSFGPSPGKAKGLKKRGRNSNYTVDDHSLHG